MPFTLTVDLPNLGDQEIYIHGLGSFGNGSHEITDQQEADFRTINAKTSFGPWDAEGNTELIHTLGPDLVTAAESMHGVTVVESSDAPSSATAKTTKRPVESAGTADKTGTPGTDTSTPGGE